MIRIEQATTEHIPQMADLLAVLFSEEAEFRPDREKQIRGLRMIIGAPERGNIFVATEEDEVVGMVSLLFTISTAKGAPACWLEDMVIRPDRRGMGIGTRLLQHAVAYAKSHGFTRITLLTDRINEKSIRFYEENGFQHRTWCPCGCIWGDGAPLQMKYLTPELYVKINEASDDEVEGLYQQWTVAGANARAHFQQIKHKLPPKMRQFCETLCLHDAEVLGINVSGGDNGARTPVAVISVRQDNKLIWLVYDLYHEPTITTPVSSDAFVSAADQRQWLYDEVDVGDEPKCRHEILLNTGEVIELVFFQFDMFVHHSPSHALQPQTAQLA